MNEESDVMVSNLSKHIGEKEGVDIYNYITLCSLDIICGTAMGVKLNAQVKSESEYVKSLYRLSDIIHTRQLSPWLWVDWVFYLTPIGRDYKKCLNIVHGFTKQVIEDRRNEMEKRKLEGTSDKENDAQLGLKQRPVFLDLLLRSTEDGKPLSDEGIREEVDTFMFEGHDTTSAGVMWALYLLGSHPECQRKAQEELDSIFGGSDRHATSEDLKEMKYLECVLKESLRIYPSVPIISRDLEEDFQVGDYNLPAGTTVGVVPIGIHRDPKVFPDPLKFDPDRFKLENSTGRNPYAYVPFSAGPRNCIGQKFAMMEEKIMVSSVLRHYNLTSLDKQDDVRLVAELILRPAKALKIRIEKRVI
jgi:cytochrome P450